MAVQADGRDGSTGESTYGGNKAELLARSVRSHLRASAN
jgi:hypothetical protein